MKRIAPLLLCSLWPAAAVAHPGHGTVEPSSAAHYLLEPAHAALAVLAVGAAAVTARFLRTRRRPPKRR